MKKLINIILVGFVVICTFFNLYHINNLDRFVNERIELLDIEPKVIVVDSLVFDTVFIERYDIVRLPIVDTLIRTDTVVAVDSVYVELPIELKQFNDTLDYTAISFDLEGFNCKIDNLYVKNFLSVPTQEKAVKTNRFGLGLQLGIGATKEGFSPYIGVGISYNFFSF